MIATLHDDAATSRSRGCTASQWTGTPVPEAELREESGVLDSVEMIGSGSIADRLFAKPAVAVLGFDAPADRGLLEPDRARGARPACRCGSLRATTPSRARDALVAHLRAAAPWGVAGRVEADEAGMGYLVDTTTPAYAAAKDALAEAFGHDVVEMGSGGSVPLVPMLAETFPGMAVLIWGAGDERSNYHSLDESVDLADLERLALAEALFLGNLGDPV